MRGAVVLTVVLLLGAVGATLAYHTGTLGAVEMYMHTL